MFYVSRTFLTTPKSRLSYCLCTYKGVCNSSFSTRILKVWFSRSFPTNQSAECYLCDKQKPGLKITAHVALKYTKLTNSKVVHSVTGSTLKLVKKLLEMPLILMSSLHPNPLWPHLRITFSHISQFAVRTHLSHYLLVTP